MEFGDLSSSSASVASTLSWMTGSSRTRISTLSSAAFSNPAEASSLGLDGVIQTVKSLSLPLCPWSQVQREEKLGEGETFIVHRCQVRNNRNHELLLAIKQLKIGSSPNDSTYRRRLKSVILELRIMRHHPLRAHPNIIDVLGYGWHKSSGGGSGQSGPSNTGGQIMPYLLVPYAAHGTFREYLLAASPKLSIQHKEILLGDVASAIAGLHACGIVHGDTKLDNVLIFDCGDRPLGTIAKLADFGHSIVLGNSGQDPNDESLRYTGKFPYNAPEVHEQDQYPIASDEMHKCDVWSFGLLVWETFLDGKEYFRHIVDEGLVPDSASEAPCYVEHPETLLDLAKKSIPRLTGHANSLRRSILCAGLAMALQVDPFQRRSNLVSYPFMSTWHSAGTQVLQAMIALHLGDSEWSYDMFRPDLDREMVWEHQVQIFNNLQTLVSNTRIRDSAEATWQLAICYKLGFGTAPSLAQASRHAQTAQSLSHPVAQVFGHLIHSDGEPETSSATSTYLDKLRALLKSTDKHKTPNILVLDFIDDNEVLVADPDQLGTVQGDVSSTASIISDACHCSIYHRIAMINDIELRDKRLHIYYHDQPARDRRDSLHTRCPIFHTIHPQWPTRLSGSPLAFALAVNNLSAVQYLLSCGADPLLPVYEESQYPPSDPRVTWNAIHLAAKYHNSEILKALLEADGVATKLKTAANRAFGCALSYLSPLEEEAIHGNERNLRLSRTIEILRELTCLDTVAPNGMTAISQAIDFHSVDTFAALVHAMPDLASLPLTKPGNKNIYDLPVIFAAQMAARRDTPDSTHILEIISSNTRCFEAERAPPMDSMGRTPLHMAVTGPSNRATSWLLKLCPKLLNIEDKHGRTALHSCSFRTNLSILLENGAIVNHTDKYGMTVLHKACLNGNLEIVQAILQHEQEKPKLDLCNNQYGTPLHCAIMNGSLEIVMALLKADSPLDKHDFYGNAPVHLAVLMGRNAIFSFLFRNHKQGADITTMRNKQGLTAQDIARRSGNEVALRILPRSVDGYETSLQGELGDEELPMYGNEQYSNLGLNLPGDDMEQATIEYIELETSPISIIPSATGDTEMRVGPNDTEETGRRKLVEFAKNYWNPH
ncbi:hypothetical protein QBC37DRAFT_376971 [Rhypophila decipiens]|uniref:Protein kinase domain-containing protein n=1 Tax=Rhypophila decipiens TaxID=261697 RepID=A0AAN6Y1S5_9PEZI|nr:hypothetical protein QBC37DRAFT_376971 [Rhypophila decipiens]